MEERVEMLDVVGVEMDVDVGLLEMGVDVGLFAVLSGVELAMGAFSGLMGALSSGFVILFMGPIVR